MPRPSTSTIPTIFVLAAAVALSASPAAADRAWSYTGSTLCAAPTAREEVTNRGESSAGCRRSSECRRGLLETTTPTSAVRGPDGGPRLRWCALAARRHRRLRPRGAEQGYRKGQPPAGGSAAHRHLPLA